MKLKKYGKVILTGVLVLAMVLQTLGQMSFVSLATETASTQTDVTAPATLKGSTLTLDGSLKANIVTELTKAARGSTHLTFSDFGMSDGVNTGYYECNAGYTSWDGLALTGDVTFGADQYLIIGSIGTVGKEWFGIQVTTAGANGGLKFGCYTPTANFNINGAGSHTITAEEAGVNFQAQAVTLEFNFDYSTTGLNLGVKVNNTYSTTLKITPKVGAEDYLLQDYMQMGIYSPGAAKVRSIGEYKELTFTDFGVEGDSLIGGSIYNCVEEYTTWDGLALTGNVSFGESGTLALGKHGNGWFGLRLTVDKTSGNLKIYCASPSYTFLTNGSNNCEVTATEANVNFQTDSVKLRLTLDYTDVGLNVGVYIKDTYVKTASFANGSNSNGTYLVKDYLGVNIWTPGGLSVQSIAKQKEYKELTFSDFDMPDGTLTNGQKYECNKSYSSWDGVALTGYISLPYDTDGVSWFNIGGASAYTGIRINTNGAGNLRIGCNIGYWVKYLVNGQSTDHVITVPGVNFETGAVKLRLTFDHIDGGLALGVYMNDKFIETVEITTSPDTPNNLITNDLTMAIHSVNKTNVSSPNLTVADGGYMSFVKPNGETEIIQAKDATKGQGSDYIFTYDMAAKEMADSVDVQFHCGDWVSQTEQYSVKKYADTIIANQSTYGAKAVELAKKLLDYGSASQKYFNYNVNNLANPSFDGSQLDVTADMLKTFAKSTQSEANIATLTSTNLILESETTLKMYFTFADGVSRNDFTFTDDEGNVLEPVASGNRYCVAFENIKAHELDKDFSVTITNNQDSSITHTYSYGPLSYCYVALSYENASAKLKNLAKAVYLYNQAAETYVLEVDETTGYALEIDAGTWDSTHVQGITKDDDNNYMYYSFTDRLVKVNMKTGQMVASVKLFENAHLGDLAYYEGKVYGSLDRAFYGSGPVDNKYNIAVFDTENMIEIDMDYKNVMKTMSIHDVNDNQGDVFEPTSFDGIAFGPKPGSTDVKVYMMLSAALGNSDRTHQTMVAFDPDTFVPSEVTNGSTLSTTGPEVADIFYVNLGELSEQGAYEAQVLEYNADQNEYWLCCYPQFKAGNLFVVDGNTVNKTNTTLGGTTQEVNVLSLKQIGTQSAEDSSVWGITKYYPYTAQGLISLGNDYFYIENSVNPGGTINHGRAKLYKFDRETFTFKSVENN